VGTSREYKSSSASKEPAKSSSWFKAPSLTLLATTSAAVVVLGSPAAQRPVGGAGFFVAWKVPGGAGAGVRLSSVRGPGSCCANEYVAVCEVRREACTERSDEAVRDGAGAIRRSPLTCATRSPKRRAQERAFPIAVIKSPPDRRSSVLSGFTPSSGSRMAARGGGERWRRTGGLSFNIRERVLTLAEGFARFVTLLNTKWTKRIDEDRCAVLRKQEKRS
jgi:hypothetical protein